MVSQEQQVVRCALYTPGHSVHWIQARLTWNKPMPHTVVTITDIDGGGFVVETAQGPVRYLNHDTARLRRYVVEVGPEGSLVGYGVLQLPITRDGGIPMICVKRDEGEPLGRCIHADDLPALPSGATPAQIAKHLLEAASRQGGATVHLRWQSGVVDDVGHAALLPPAYCSVPRAITTSCPTTRTSQR